MYKNNKTEQNTDTYWQVLLDAKLRIYNLIVSFKLVLGFLKLKLQLSFFTYFVRLHEFSATLENY